jgi:hypothetical protein
MEFLTEVRRVLLLTETSPASFPRLLDVPADLVVRRALLPRFPFATETEAVTAPEWCQAVEAGKHPRNGRETQVLSLPL